MEVDENSGVTTGEENKELEAAANRDAPPPSSEVTVTLVDGTVQNVEPGNEVKLKRVGPGFPPVQHQFSKTNQPDPKKQSETKKRKKFNREILAELMNMRYTFPEGSEVKKQLTAAFGEKMVTNKTAMEIATLMQLMRSVLKGDTNSYRELMIQAFGQPKQTAELSGPDGKDLFESKTDTELAALLQNLLDKLK